MYLSLVGRSAIRTSCSMVLTLAYISRALHASLFSFPLFHSSLIGLIRYVLVAAAASLPPTTTNYVTLRRHLRLAVELT